MFARQQITAADANLLTGYGINVYQALADATGTDVKKIRDLGTKGKLGLKSILTVFRTLSEQSKGAQASAMNSWDGMFAQMEANLLEFRIKVANSGPLKKSRTRCAGCLTGTTWRINPGNLTHWQKTLVRNF
ncbi:phage tape measure protein [Escherichia coli]|uniref:Phage tape measure protein n=1 Tax=Escherichia coli TaxID=562 RepID=A0A2X3K9C1_ECOLX|nr:phage tape measure protein [Escherichia coli]